MHGHLQSCCQTEPYKTQEQMNISVQLVPEKYHRDPTTRPLPLDGFRLTNHGQNLTNGR